jgi:hypothetical protein
MIPSMSRALVLALLIGSTGCAACGNGSKSPADQPKTTKAGEPEKIAVPGPGPNVADQATKGGPGQAAPATADDPRFHLKPEEGAISVDKAQAKAGAEATAALKLAPATGYHIATDYPIKLTLEAPAGVKLAKTELSAGGRNKDQGDASTLSEQALAFAIKATAEKAGSYEIKGVFKFGICEKESCHPKKQPITITVAAN